MTIEKMSLRATDTQGMATESTMLAPRFYTTDFEALDRMDVSAVREEWDRLLDEMESDPNRGHFKRNEDWEKIDFEALPEGLRNEFVDFMVSSLTAEFSGCVLYKEMKKRGTNPDIVRLFGYMSRDEARHAGFINDALKELHVLPPEIHLLRHLSVGEDRLRPLHHHLPASGAPSRAPLPPNLQMVREVVQ
jgi:magnesium-protoporphyrin IX monomethyl ester (oxidative) cyclase